MVQCKFFLRGYCQRGEYCRYHHDTKSSVAETTNLSPLQTWTSLDSSRKPTDSGDFTPIVSPAVWTAPGLETTRTGLADPTQDPRSLIVCQFHARGNCKKGTECPYAHAARSEVELGSDPDDEPEYDNFQRVFSDAVTKFDEGAQVLKISLPADFSAARISGLTVDNSPEGVVAALSSIGITLDAGCVRILPQSSAADTTADILVEDPAFAKSLCTTVERRRSMLPPHLSQIETTKAPPRLSPGSSARRIECQKVQCSWFKPSRTAWLNFGNEVIVRRVYEKFRTGSYQILKQLVHCNPPAQSGGGFRNPYSWTLMLKDLPASIDDIQVRSAILSPQDRPRHIELGRPSYDVDGEQASATVLSLLSQIGPIEWSQANTQLEGKRAKAVARFYEEADAREAARALHDKPLSFGKNLKLAAQLLSTAKFKVHQSIFGTVRSQIGIASETWRKKNMKFKIYPNAGVGQQYRIIKIEGQVAEDVAAAKETMDKILNGDLIEHNGQPLWTPSLKNNGAAAQKLKKIQQDHGVVVIRDTRKAELRICGSPEKFAEAELAIRDMIATESSRSRAIDLAPEAFQWASRGGFKMVMAALGEGVPTFDIVSKKILIDGSEKDYEAALKLIKERESNLHSGAGPVEGDCPVCLTPAENPVRIACGHTYCLECFEGLCAHAGSEATAFPVRCPGNTGTCRQVFALKEIQENLSSQAFEDLLEVSFASHVKRHPLMFRYCPKPGCETIYRVTENMKMNTCAKCITVTCTCCHAQHEDMSCADHKEIASGGYAAFEKYKKESGIKDCPACKTPIEKTEGCNHMICRGCGTHICWVCLETFSTRGPCYAHMTEKHGGIGLEFLENLE